MTETQGRNLSFQQGECRVFWVVFPFKAVTHCSLYHTFCKSIFLGKLRCWLTVLLITYAKVSECVELRFHTYWTNFLKEKHKRNVMLEIMWLRANTLSLP